MLELGDFPVFSSVFLWSYFNLISAVGLSLLAGPMVAYTLPHLLNLHSSFGPTKNPGGSQSLGPSFKFPKEKLRGLSWVR